MTLKEYYKIRLEEQLDEGFMDAVRATGSGIKKLGNSIEQNPRKALKRGVAGLAAAGVAAGVVAGAYKLGQQSGAPDAGRNSSPMVGVPSGSGGGGIDEPGVRRPDEKVRKGPSGERWPWITPGPGGPTTPEP